MNQRIDNNQFYVKNKMGLLLEKGTLSIYLSE